MCVCSVGIGWFASVVLVARHRWLMGARTTRRWSLRFALVQLRTCADCVGTVTEGAIGARGDFISVYCARLWRFGEGGFPRNFPVGDAASTPLSAWHVLPCACLPRCHRDFHRLSGA